MATMIPMKNEITRFFSHDSCCRKAHKNSKVTANDDTKSQQFVKTGSFQMSGAMKRQTKKRVYRFDSSDSFQQIDLDFISTSKFII